MKIEKVSYQKAYIIGPYLQEKVGFEASIDGDSPEEVLSKLRKMADDWHKENNPHLDAPMPGQPLPIIQKISDDALSFVDQQFEQLKNELEKIELREEAEQILANSDFRFNMDLKKLVNSKPTKND